MRRVTINDPTTNRTAPQQPRQRCPEGLVSYKAVPLPKNISSSVLVWMIPNIDVPVYDQVQPEIFEEYMKTTENTSPLSFLSSRLSQFTKATRIFTTRDYTHTNVAAEFHQACDNIPNTLVIIKSGQYIAGGYTEVAWSSPDRSVAAYRAFVFSVNRQKVYAIRNKGKAMHCHKDYGPIFGGDGDLAVCGDYAGWWLWNDRGGCSEMRDYDTNGVADKYTELMDSKYFKVDEYEVYKLE